MDYKDIEYLSLQQLIELHNTIVKRIRELQKNQLSQQMQYFQVADHVSFLHEATVIEGIVIRINQKSLTIKTKEGCWYVDPRKVTKISLDNK